MGRGEQRVAEHSLSFVLSVKSVKSVVNSVFCFRLLQTDRFKRRHLPIEAGQVSLYPFFHGKDQSISYRKGLSWRDNGSPDFGGSWSRRKRRGSPRRLAAGNSPQVKGWFL